MRFAIMGPKQVTIYITEVTVSSRQVPLDISIIRNELCIIYTYMYIHKIIVVHVVLITCVQTSQVQQLYH